MKRVQYQPTVVQDIINDERHGELELSPWYQRRAVWLRQQKAYLINTIFEQKPVPSLYIRHTVDLEKEKSIKQVVDGQQRIRAVLEYHANGFPARHPAHKQPVTYSQLSAKQKHAFLMTSLSVGTLIGAEDADVIEIFGRLNSVAKTLNAQEKRNAQFSGEFKQFCLRQAAMRIPFWRDYGIFTANGIARMSEVQFVSELTMALLDGLTDYSAKRITEYYERYDSSFPQANDVAEYVEAVFAEVASISISAVRETIFSRPPLLFTLLLVLHSMKERVGGAFLEQALHRIDGIFHADIPLADHQQDDAAFIAACASNPHRIRSRRIRDAYVRHHLS